MTPLQMHLNEWKTCTKCEYSEKRDRIVLGRGDIPCDILFLGEAPGASENSLGLPFIGKAGKILDRIIVKSIGSLKDSKYKIAFNNVIACIPLVDGHEKEEPDYSCVMECRPRVEEFIRIAQPNLIVCVGKISEEWTDQRHKDSIKIGNIPRAVIQHPASILRMPLAAQSLAEQRCTVILRSAIREHLGE